MVAPTLPSSMQAHQNVADVAVKLDRPVDVAIARKLDRPAAVVLKKDRVAVAVVANVLAAHAVVEAILSLRLGQSRQKIALIRNLRDAGWLANR